MTICVSVKVNDCLIFAADSATSIVASNGGGQAQIANIYAHGNKVFNLYKHLPVAAMTAGMGNIGAASISTLAKDFRSLMVTPNQPYYVNKEEYSVEEIVTKARLFFFEEKYSRLDTKPPEPHAFNFWVGGYGSGKASSEVWLLSIENGNCAVPKCLQAENVCGVDWGGQPEAINRLVLGYSQRLPAVLKTAGISDEDLPKLIARIAEETAAPVYSPAMPVQDAVALAEFLVYATKMFVRFNPGADTVGGEIDIAAVTKHEGFKWVRRKHYYPTNLNPLETDHV